MKAICNLTTNLRISFLSKLNDEDKDCLLPKQISLLSLVQLTSFGLISRQIANLNERST